METLIAIWDFMALEKFPAWFMTWHWGWQVVFGLMVFGLVSSIFEYFKERTMAQVGEDIAVWCLDLLTKIMNGIANILAIATPIIMIFIILHFTMEG